MMPVAIVLFALTARVAMWAIDKAFNPKEIVDVE